MTGDAAVLARALDYAGCSAAQASAVLLFHRGLSTAAVARALRLPYPKGKAALTNGLERLEKAFRGTLAHQLAWYRALLRCVKNHRDTRPAPVLTYAPIPGGYDATPVTVRARPRGSVAEDFVDPDDPRAFLQVLCRTLRG